jgi:uncharacterized protein YerC
MVKMISGSSSLKRIISVEQMEQIVVMSEKGRALPDIADETKLSHDTILRYKRYFNLV